MTDLDRQIAELEARAAKKPIRLYRRDLSPTLAHTEWKEAQRQLRTAKFLKMMKEKGPIRWNPKR